MRYNFVSISALAPVIRQSVDTYTEILDGEKSNYTITDGIGFDSAGLTLTGSNDYLIDWYEKGLVRDITFRSPDGGICWEGFVQRMSLTLGDITFVKSIDNLVNRITLVYTPLDTAENPPTAKAKTSITVNDTLSQALYGIKERMISAGECTAATADDYARSELNKFKYIVETETESVGQQKQSALQLTLQGYAHMGNWFIYSQTTNSGTINANTMVGNILTADPNSVLSTSTVNIDTNATATEQYIDGQVLGWKKIQEVAARGLESGGTGYPWHCGVYERRQTTFKAAEGMDVNQVPYSTNKHLALHRYISDGADMFVDEGGREWLPWELRPDRLRHLEGIPGRPMYILQVKVSMPWKVTLAGTSRTNPMYDLVKVCS